MANRQQFESEETTIAYVMGELTPAEKQLFEQQMADDDTLKQRTDEAGDRVVQLRAMPEEPIKRDLTPDIMNAVRALAQSEAESTKAITWFPRMLRIAASLVILLGAVMLVEHVTRQPMHQATATREDSIEEAIQQGRAWLVVAQESSGAWEAENWGGQAEHTIGLTALALLALIDEDYDQGPYAQHIERGAAYLLEGQDHRGCFDTLSLNESYNHGMTLLALFEVYEQQPTPALRNALSHGLAYLRHSQDLSSGWSYESPRSSSSPTIWTLAALHRAQELGWHNAGLRAAKGTAWLDEHKKVMVSEMQDVSDAELLCLIAQSHAKDQAAIQALLATQVQQGALAGSWNTSRGSNAAGGRIYATARSTLALRAGPPHS